MLMLVLFFATPPVRLYYHVLVSRTNIVLLLRHQRPSSISREISCSKLPLLPVMQWLICIILGATRCYHNASREGLHARMMIISLSTTHTIASKNWTVDRVLLLVKVWAGEDLLLQQVRLQLLTACQVIWYKTVLLKTTSRAWICDRHWTLIVLLLIILLLMILHIVIVSITRLRWHQR